MHLTNLLTKGNLAKVTNFSLVSFLSLLPKPTGSLLFACHLIPSVWLLAQAFAYMHFAIQLFNLVYFFYQQMCLLCLTININVVFCDLYLQMSVSVLIESV